MGTTNEELFVKMVLDAWFGKLKRADELFDSLPDEALQNEVAPGRNRGVYLLGHLTAAHDALLPLLGFGDTLYPEMFDTFLIKPDRAVEDLPSVEELRDRWKKVHEVLIAKCTNETAKGWFEKHTSVSEADFATQPHRNKLNVIISRTNHLDFHLGQLIFLKTPKA